MAKDIIYSAKVQTKIRDGITKVADAVTTTLGPAGKNVIITLPNGTNHITKDGVTVARSIVLDDPFENAGANAIKEVAEKSNSNVGDGTTTTTLLAATIYKEGLRYSTFGGNVTQIKNGIRIAAAKVIEYIKQISKAITTRDEIKYVATISANGDKEIGEIIAEVMHKIGNDGTIKVENGNSTTMSSRIVEGMVIDQAYASPYMVTNPDTLEAELNDTYVLIVDKKLSNIQELLPCLQSVSKSGASLFIIAEDYQDDILATLVMNKLRGFNCVAIKAPSYGSNRKAIMEDIAILCGGQVVSDSTGITLDRALAGGPVLGIAKRVIVTNENTVIVGGRGDEEDIENRIASIKTLIDKTTDEYELPKLKERLAKLTNGIGIITVGGETESELKEKRDRVDDAFAAATAAVKHGIVPGGGIALLRAQNYLNDNLICTDEFVNYSVDEQTGIKILCNSLSAPIEKILSNADENASVIVKDVVLLNRITMGYDVISKRYTDMIESGIIDPTEVVINEINNASSIAGLLLTTSCIITDKIDEK
jgi:chaperonin GroEL